MGILLTTTAGLVVWIVLWSIGVKAIDGFLVTIVMVFLAVGAHILVRYVPNRSQRDH